MSSAKMPEVDLTLAVNYLPACACLCKLCALMLVLGLIPPGDEVRGGYIPLATVLYIDRACTRNLIFDANAILLAVYFANVHAAVRASSLGGPPFYWFWLWGLHLCWIGQCLLLVFEPSKIRWFLEHRVQASKAVGLFLMALVLSGTAHLHCELEPAPMRACRALAFTLLAFAWIYVVGIHSSGGLEYLKETSSQFILLLAPVLYSPPFLAGAFLVAAATGLGLQYSQRFAKKPEVEPALPEPAPEPVVVAVKQEPPPAPPSEEITQLQELFRQAKQVSQARKSAGVRLEPVTEDKAMV